MEDEIDIEEHDVLDNPKIRDIFPDLSLVKVEVPDEDVTEQYNDSHESELQYDYNIKQEVPSDNEQEYEQNNELCYKQSEQSGQSVLYYQSFSDTTGYHTEQNKQIVKIRQIEQIGQIEQNKQIESEVPFNNKIILGSKPIDYDLLYQEALKSNVQIHLENWDMILKSSPCYCNSCETLFPTVNALYAHNSTTHSFLIALVKPNTARKSTVTTSIFCNHCNNTFPNDTALITHLYELLPLNNFQKPAPSYQKPNNYQPSPVKVKTYEFKCIKCNKYFASFVDGKRHKKLKHPSLTNFNLIVKIVNKNDNIKPKSLPKGKKYYTSNLIPKSILFQCNICHINFVSCYTAIQHSHTCENRMEFHKCNICKRKIRKWDTDIHELQHKYTEKLKIYTIHKAMYEKVLLKCPKCSICYDEQAFRIHEKNCDGSQSHFVRCKICSIDITSSRYDYHKNKHESKKYTQKDFIIVEFYNLHEKSNQKVKNIEKVDQFAAKNTNLYYCSTCCSYKNILSPNGHTANMCKSLNVHFCEICGLGFARHTFYVHKMLHKKHNLTLKDFKIFSLQTGEAIDTPMSNFHRCEYCGIHFLTTKAVLNHNCEKEMFNTCEICNKKFNTKAYSPHCNLHNLDGFPELLKKYNSINNMWNVKYLCVSCNMVTMSYDSAVEHSQNHINEIHKFNTKFCVICEFKILDKHYKMHMNLHENNILLDRSQFTILEYDYKELFTSKWMNMLSPLPKQHKYLILIKSIYRFSRRFKLNCKINCQTDDYKLYCMKCKTSVNMQQMKNHYFTNACRYSSEYTCGTCMLQFKRLHNCVLHEAEHDTIAKNYKVITYNDEKDAIFDQKLKNFELASSNKSTPVKSIQTSRSVKPAKFKTKSSVKSIKSKLKNSKAKASKAHFSDTLEGIIEKYNRFKLYKCEKCNSCVSLKQNVVKHNCIFKASRKRLCVICKQYFYSKSLHVHMQLHKKYPRIKKTIVIPFNCDKNTATIYQCECGLNFTSKQSIDKHINICNDNLIISKEKCSKCNLLFPTEVLVSHLCKHHSKPVDIKIEKIKRIAQNVYQCAKCKVVYANVSDFEDHIFYCPVKTGIECEKCYLLIDQKTFSDHKCNQEISIVKNNAVSSTVYRCSSCNLTYLFKESLNYHLEVKHVSQRDKGTCDICDLRFTIQTLSKHSLLHKKSDNYIIKVIDTESNNSSIIKGSNYKLNFIPKTNRGALNNKKLSIKNSNQKVSVDQKNSQKEVDQKISDNEIVNKTSNTTVFKCGACNICYLLRKRWYYHSSNNHILKHRRRIVPCSICGLRFPHIFLEKHMTIHAVGENYSIKVIEPDTRKITVITGKNKKSANTKRKLKSDDSITKNKKAKIDNILIDQSLPVKKINKDDNFTDLPSTSKTSSIRSRRIKKEVAVTSNPKMDFESVSMSEDDTILSNDEINADPINNTTGSDAAKSISKKLKTKLNNSLRIYNNTLYRSKCNLNFMAKRSANNHTLRDCRGKCIAYKCNLCPFEFTKKSLIRHQYVHHTKMKLKPEHIHIELFREDEIQRKSIIDRRKVEIVAENGKINYYKCKDCNVCFIDENNCKRHCISHIPLDSKSYIECKICNFQFLIESLQKHVNVHHSTAFCLEDLVITEYTVTGDRNPKIEVYRGVDKVQSKLVSTTSDMTVESSEADIFGL